MVLSRNKWLSCIAIDVESNHLWLASLLYLSTDLVSQRPGEKSGGVAETSCFLALGTHNRARDLALPLSGERRLEPQGGGLQSRQCRCRGVYGSERSSLRDSTTALSADAADRRWIMGGG